jgi:catechol 2,3-dioxygenase-like lactoylglutathione lyase family enzyme
MTTSPAASTAPVAPLRGIHHLKFAVSDLDRALDFYQQALGARRIPQLDHRHDNGTPYAYILELQGLGTYLELRLNPAQAAKHRRFDSLTITVDDRTALEQWDQHLTTLRLPHSPVLVSLHAWLLVLEDPDQNRIRLYTNESHGPELHPDHDNPWLTT